MKAFYINLNRRADRNELFQKRFHASKIQLPIERFNAVDGRAVKRTKELEFLFRGNDFNFAQGVTGCALSHFSLWQQLVKESSCDRYFIFEDDIWFVDDAVQRLSQVQEELKKLGDDFDICYLGGSQPGVRVSKNLATVAAEISYGLHGYMLSKCGAEKILEIITKRGIYRAVDCLILDYIPPLKAYVATPWIEHTLPFSKDSDINGICTPISA